MQSTADRTDFHRAFARSRSKIKQASKQASDPTLLALYPPVPKRSRRHSDSGLTSLRMEESELQSGGLSFCVRCDRHCALDPPTALSFPRLPAALPPRPSAPSMSDSTLLCFCCLCAVCAVTEPPCPASRALLHRRQPRPQRARPSHRDRQQRSSRSTQRQTPRQHLRAIPQLSADSSHSCPRRTYTLREAAPQQRPVALGH